MFSLLRKGLLYENISSDITEHDLENDADSWVYDEREVFRGSIDPEYIKYDLNSYWLYDDNSLRIGLAEHESNSPEIFKVLWIYENPYSTLFQDTSWKCTETTLWSKLTDEAYQDCLETDFQSISDNALQTNVLLVTPKMLIDPPKLYTCEKCKTKTLLPKNMCSGSSHSILDFNNFSVLFLDDDYVLYEKVTATQQDDVCDHLHQEQKEPLVEQVDQQELKDALVTQEPPQNHQSPPAQQNICLQQSTSS